MELKEKGAVLDKGEAEKVLLLPDPGEHKRCENNLGKGIPTFAVQLYALTEWQEGVLVLGLD